MTPDIDDSNILLRFRSPLSRNSAFEDLIDKYKERLYYHIRRMVIDHDDADDLLQDTFVKVWQNLEKFQENSGLFTWLYRIATNECLNFLRKKNKYVVNSMDDSTYLLETLETSQYINGSELQIKLQHAILTLPEKQRLVFNMKYFDELKYEEMTEILGTSVGALKASYHHAVKKIEEYFKKD